MSRTTTTTTTTSTVPVASTPEKPKLLPVYIPPTTGILSYLPPSWVPYAQLARVEKPTGIFNIYFPYLFGALFASWSDNTPPAALLLRSFTLFAAAFVLRSAGCSWNDIVDRDADKLVTRCRLRPMARGALTVPNALIFTAAQTVLWLSILSLVIPDHWAYTIPLIAMVMFYPYAKQVTDYAQVFLGFTLSIGVLIGSSALGMDPLSTLTTDVAYSSGLACLFLSYVLWSVIHDTVYAQQDVKDDIKAGHKSMAVRYRYIFKQLLSALCVLQTLLLVYTGSVVNAGVLYQVLAPAGSAAIIAWMLVKVNTSDPEDCAWWFRNGCMAFGAIVSAGLFAEYLSRSGPSVADFIALLPLDNGLVARLSLVS